MRRFQNNARDAASQSGPMRLQARAGRWLRVIPLAVAGGMLSLVPASAADDLPIVGDIQMPHIRMPSVDVDVRIGDEARPYLREPYAAMPPPRYVRDLPERPAVSDHEVAMMLRANGYSLLGRVNRRGWVYTVAVLDRNGDDGRAVIDARTGAIIRFVPALNVDPRFDEELTVIYGPPGPPLSPPPVANVNYENRRGSLLDLQRSPRPAVNVPRSPQRTANKTPAANSTQPATKPQAATPPAATTAENKPAATTVGAATALPSPQTPSPELKLWPTQAMPAAQSLE